MIAGTLELQLLANVAKLRQDMAEAKGVVVDAMGGINRAIEGTKALLAGLGAGATLAGFARLVTHATEVGEQLSKMSQKTGVAVEQLSALRYAATLSDVSMETLGKGMKGLSTKMVEATDATGKAGQIMAALGVNVQGGAAPAIEKLADAFAILPDGPTKAALAVEVFGKAGMEMIPLLNQGSEGLRKMRDEAYRLGLVMDEGTAKAAETFNDNLKVIKMGSERLGISLVNDFAPGLVRVTNAMKEAATGSGTLAALWVALGGIASEALGLNRTDAEESKRRIRDLEATILKAQETIAAGAKALGGGILDKSGVIEAERRLKEATAALALERAKADKTWRAQEGGAFDFGPNGKKLGDGAAGSALEERIRNLLGGTKQAAAAMGEDLDKLLEKVLATSSGLEADFPKSVAALNVAMNEGKISLDAYAHAMDGLTAKQPIFRKELEARIAAAKEANEEAQKAFDADERQQKITNDAIKSVADHAAALEFETSIMGLSNAEREKAIALRRLELAGVNVATKDVAELTNRIRDQVQAQQAMRDTVSVWNELADAGGNFFANLLQNGREAFSGLRSSLRQFLAEIVALFAKRWILQIGASLLGSSGAGLALANTAGTIGNGSIAGSLLSSAGSILGGTGVIGGAIPSGLGTLLGGGTGGAVAASELMGSLSALGPYAAAAAAVYALYQTFKDKGENWKGRIGFGSGANAYATNGVFGAEGFQYLAGDDATNRAIQGFFASTRGIDTRLASRLTPAQMAAIRSGLAAYNTSGTRWDGQPAEFAFGKGDSTAAEQLSIEYLKQKYSVVFGQIDKDFAKFVMDFTGTADELLKKISDYAGVLDGIDALGLKGLDVAALKGFQKDGEELGDTLARIAKQWTDAQDALLSDEQKLQLVQDGVVKAFDDLGIAMPKTSEELANLIAGLDLSTEEGRAMFDALTKIAPAFATVANASKSLLATFDQIVGAMRPGYTRGALESNLQSEVTKFMGAASWTAGMDWHYVAEQLRSITREDFQNYSLSQQATITAILQILSQLDGLDNAATTTTSGITDLGRAATDTAARMAEVKSGLWDYLRGLSSDSSLSPLDPRGQLEALKRQYTDTLGLANGGDLSAASALQGLIDRGLQLGRTVFASGSGYVDLFNWFMQTAGDFAKDGGGQMLQQGIYQEARTQSLLLGDVKAILLDIRDRPTADGTTTSSAIANASAAAEPRR